MDWLAHLENRRCGFRTVSRDVGSSGAAPKTPGRTGRQLGPYRPDGRSRPISIRNITITAIHSFRSVIGSGIGPLLEQADSATPGEADVPAKSTQPETGMNTEPPDDITRN